MAIRRFACAAGVLFVASAAARAADEPWTFDRVVAAVEWREAQFANCSFSFKEEAGRVPGTWYTMVADVKIRQPMTRCRYDFTYPDDARLNLKAAEWVWDGKRSLSLGKRAAVPNAGWKAAVQESREDFLKHKSFEFMGTLFPEERVSAQLREAAGRKEAKVLVAEADYRGERTVTVTVEAASLAYPIITYAFLPEKDMLLRGSTTTYFLDDALRTVPQLIEAAETEKYEQREGVWVSVETLCSRDDRKDEPTKFKYRLTAFSRTAPPPEDFDMAFPPTTVVNDRVAGSMYRVEKDGSHTQLSFFDVDTGRVVEPLATQPATAKPASTRPATGAE